MHGVLLAIRLVLTLVMAVAGTAKLADRAGTRDAVAGFGIPDRLGRPIAALLPLAELCAAVLLVPSATTAVGAGLALVLLASFSAAIARSIARGETPDCHCFGQLHSSPAGPATLARNLTLVAAAALVLAGGPGTSATGWAGRLSTSAALAVMAAFALALVVAGGGWLVFRLLRRNGELLLRIDALQAALTAGGIALPPATPEPATGLPIGTPAPDFALEDLHRRRVSFASLRSDAPATLLVFTDPGCGPCTAMMPMLGAWQREHRNALRTVIVSRGGREANLAHAREHGLLDLLIQDDREVGERFGALATPAAVLVDGEGRIASQVHAGAEEITALLHSRTAPPLAVHHHEPVIGGPAPDPILGTLHGERVTLSSRLAGRTVVLFWNPACGFCERMLDDLRRVERTRTEHAPGLLVLSAGGVDENRAMGLHAPVLLDDAFLAGSAFGAAGTPSAVLVDEDGRVASGVAVGADAVLELLEASPAAVAA